MSTLMPNLKFKVREKTAYILLAPRHLNGKRMRDLQRQAYRDGDFDTNYNFLIHSTGEIEEGRGYDTVAGVMIPDCEETLAIILDGDKVSDVHKEALKPFLSLYPNAEVVVWSEEDEDEFCSKLWHHVWESKKSTYSVR